MKPFFLACKELLFPAHCLECKRQLPCWELPLFCDDCLAGVSYIAPPACACCGIPFASGEDHLCGPCLAGSYSFHLARAAVLYQEPVISLISSLKFKKDLTSLSTLAKLATTSAGFDMLTPPDLILPVPLHKDRLRERGFNQAYLLAREIFPAHRKKIIPTLLTRTRPTRPQTGLSGSRRRKNLTRAFSIKQPQMVQGQKILLVDDVFTTGSTVHECARVLHRSRAQRIEVFTLARTF